MEPDIPSQEDYKKEVAEIRTELNLKLPYAWIQVFLFEFYPGQHTETSFKNQFTNFLRGKSYSAGYLHPGFMKNLKSFYQSKLKNNEHSTIKS